MIRPKFSAIVLAGGLILTSLACNLLSAGSPAPTDISILPSPQVPNATSMAPLQTTLPTDQATTTSPASPIPTLAPTQIPDTPAPPTYPAKPDSDKEYAVILVGNDDVLNVRSGAGADQPVVGKLTYNSVGIRLTGQEHMVGDDSWVEIQGPETGWVNMFYLTEVVKPAKFCSDQRVNRLLEDLGVAITTSNGDKLSSLISPVHGLRLQYFHTGNIAAYTPTEAKWVFKSDYVMNWGTHPASGLEVKGTFRNEVLPTLVDVYKSNFRQECNQPETGGASYPVSWPPEYTNVNFYSLFKPGTPGNELDWRTYLVGVEYVDGIPYLFALIHFFWEP